MNLPIFWVYLDRLDESFAEIEKAVLTEILPMMEENKIGALITYIDALTGAQIAKNIGAEEFPMIIILSGRQHYHEPLDMESRAKTMQDTIMEWHRENSEQAGQMQGAGDEYYYEDEKVGGGTTGNAPDDLYEDDDALYHEEE